MGLGMNGDTVQTNTKSYDFTAAPDQTLHKRVHRLGLLTFLSCLVSVSCLVLVILTFQKVDLILKTNESYLNNLTVKTDDITKKLSSLGRQVDVLSQDVLKVEETALERNVLEDDVGNAFKTFLEGSLMGQGHKQAPASINTEEEKDTEDIKPSEETKEEEPIKTDDEHDHHLHHHHGHPKAFRPPPMPDLLQPWYDDQDFLLSAEENDGETFKEGSGDPCPPLPLPTCPITATICYQMKGSCSIPVCCHA